jgi:adenylate cyclase class 2
MALKRREGGLQGQQEVETDIYDFEKMAELLREAGLKEMAYQESKREVWHLDGCDVDLDLWPHLDPILRIEGVKEVDIRNCAEHLGMNWAEARFQTAADLYQEKYGKEGGPMVIEQVSRITFDGPNPFAN